MAKKIRTIFDDNSVPFEYKNEKYVVVEASGQGYCNYVNALAKNVEMGDDGQVKRFSGIADAEIVLLADCVKRQNPQTSGTTAVTEQTIRSWPRRLLKDLIEVAKDISEIDVVAKTTEQQQEQEQTLKNDPEPTQDGSK